MADFVGRWSRARAAMKAAHLDGLLLTTEPSVFYFSGTVGSRPPGLVITADDDLRPVLVCRDQERDSVAALTDLEVVPAGKGEAGKVLADVMRRLGLNGGKVGFEDASMTVADHAALQASLSDIRLDPASAVAQQVRLVKDAEELDFMRQAGIVSDLAMTAAVNTLKARGTESHAAAAAESTMREHGMFIAYETLIGSGFRSGLLRRFPKLDVPGADDIIKIDLAAKLSFASGYGYHTDQTRSITVGSPSPEKRELLEIVVEVQKATLAALRPGRTIREVSLEGLAMVKGTRWETLTSMSGHGIGLDVHEWPSFNETSAVVLEAGQCYAIEPHIVVPSRHTVCVEDTLVVTADGHERITKLPYELWR